MSDSTTPAVQDDRRLFIGMDVHVRNSYLSVSDAAGRTVKRGRVGNTLGELAAFLGPLEQRPMRVVLESTTNTRAACGLLRQYARQSGATLSAEPLNARKLRVIAESVSKCDKLDAAALAELARSRLKLPACYLPDDEVFALREHLRARADLVRVRTMLKNRLHALLHRRGVLVPAKLDLFTKAGRAWLKALTLDDEAGRQILGRQLAVIDELDAVIDQSTASLRTLARSQRWCKDEALLRTIPGVGLITALTILAELGDVGRFRSRAAVSNYAGLVPVVRDSDSKHYGGGITRRGPAALRGALAEAAWVAVGRVPQYAAIFARVAGRRGKQVAIVAVARRMLEDAWTMLKTGKVFRSAPAATTTTTQQEQQRINGQPAAEAAEALAAGVVVDPGDAG